MHRDKKLGLALALMVIGIGTAFCFKQDLSQLSEGSFFEGAFTGGTKTEPVAPISPSPDIDGMGNLASSTPEPRDPFNFSEPGNPERALSNGLPSSPDLDRASRRKQNDSFAHSVSKSYRSPDWNDSPGTSPAKDSRDANSNLMANSSGRELPSRNYHVPEHNSDWDSPQANHPENTTDTRDLTARTAPSGRTPSENRSSPFESETHFTAYPELLNESDQRENSYRKEPAPEEVARRQPTRQNVSDNGSQRPRLNQSIVTLDETFDPFGESIDTKPATGSSSSMGRTTSPSQYRNDAVAPREVAQTAPTARPLEERAISPLGEDTMLVHEVRRAETLSGISARYLGSAHQFMQIFEANRDVLKSPHDIRVGMKLRIPRAESSQQATQPRRQEVGAKLDPQRVSQSWHQEPVESLPEPSNPTRNEPLGPYNSNEDKFVPVRRYPFGN
ncbi:LysM domain/BON superfamily protein [Polystyrenella longa]|uniref:LysM domain/BON superfamily protein n=1 Tax=Polystyrenella longa TaxID=2528007 RepID=A0A518CQ45_9PLAN|nr:LysM peptidoglycan-binding domain-containing protein [Polystyrenella longa]QDU81345.1 LysM domain/BON superfamily protein [Polystyrenella longa]